MDKILAKELDLVLTEFRNNPMFFIGTKSTRERFSELGLRLGEYDYAIYLKDEGLIRKTGPFIDSKIFFERGYYSITIKGKLFVGFEATRRIDRNNRIRKYTWEVIKPLIGVCVGWLLAQYQNKGQANIVLYPQELPKMSVVRQEFHLKDGADTSLVRLVKQPKAASLSTAGGQGAAGKK